MNKMPDNSIIVIDMVTNTIKARVNGGEAVERMKAIGFAFNDGVKSLTTSDEKSKKDIIDKLIKENAFFI